MPRILHSPAALLLFSLTPAWLLAQQSNLAPSISVSTFLGGNGSDEIDAIAADTSGNIYISGSTSSTDLPVSPNAFQKTVTSGNKHAFVAKLSPQADAILYLTYLGGSKTDSAAAIAVDARGNAYVAGTTTSSDFPITQGAAQTHYGGAGVFGDAFIAKLDPTGSQLIYSTFLGGSKDEIAAAIAVDATGSAYVAGATRSSNFPVTPGAFQQYYAGGNSLVSGSGGDGFVTKIDPTGSRFIYSTYLGGGGEDAVLAIALDSAGDAVVAGGANSSDFPTTAGAIQRTFGGRTDVIDSTGDAFVAKLDPTGSQLLFSTFLGGSSADDAGSISLDSTGNIYVQGCTASGNFPTAQPFQPRLAGKTDAFLAKLDPTGAHLLYSTYFGGTGTECALGTVDTAGNVYFTGSTDSLDLPLANAALPYFGNGDGYIARFDAAGSILTYSTYVGGGDFDDPQSIVRAPSGNLFIAGSTFSQDYPTLRALQSTKHPNWYDGFLTGISEIAPPSTSLTADLAVTITSDHTSISNNDTVKFTVKVTNGGPAIAEGVVIRQLLPAAFNLAALTPTQGSCSGDRYIACNIGSLNPGQEADAIITANVPTGLISISGPLDVPIAVISSTFDPRLANNSSQVTLTESLKGTAPGSGGAGGGGCFIATAAYGSYLDPHVQALRRFRDAHLLTNAVGRSFVRYYYRHSPPIAAFISNHPAARAAARYVLTPLLFAIEFPLRATALLGILLIGLLAVIIRHRRRKQRLLF